MLQAMRDRELANTRNGPAVFSMRGEEEKTGSFLGGSAATTKSGIPFYGPALLMSTGAGAVLGWKTIDKLIERKRKKDMAADLQHAQSRFYNALLEEPTTKTASAEPSVAQVLNRLYDAYATLTKRAVDTGNVLGQAAGGYGVYAALTGLLAGSLAYNRTAATSRRAVLELALKKRQRRKFLQQPTELIVDESTSV
jgi:hypothetical protein